MEIQVELTEQDHADFYKAYGFKRNWIVKGLILLLIDIIVCICLDALLLQLVIILAVLLFPFFFLIPYLVTKAKLKRWFEGKTAPLSKKTFRPFATGVEIVGEGEEVFLRYVDVKKAGKVGNYVFLILLDGDYYLLPKWCFSSEHELYHFLRLVRSGIANEKGIKPYGSTTFKPVYLVGILCLLPGIGAIAGLVLLILGIVHYKDRVFIIMGSVGIVITIAVYSSLFYFASNSDVFRKGFADIAQTEINDLVKDIEFYKLQHGAYPDSLQQIVDKNSMISIYDVSQENKAGSTLPSYRYKKMANKYLLFSPGLDGKINTPDDIYPTLSNPDTSKLGFIRKK